MNNNPLGSWSDLKPSIWKQIIVLTKARFLMKFRNIATVIEILISLVLIFIGSFAYFFTGSIYPSNPNPPVENLTNQTIIDWFLSYGKDVIAVFNPDIPLMHYLIGNTTMLKLAIEGGNVPGTNITLPGCKSIYTNSERELEKNFFNSVFNVIGITWENAHLGESSLINPKIKVQVQNVKHNANLDFFIELRNSIISMLYANNSEKYETSLSLNTTLYKSEFSHPKIEEETNIYSFAYGIIACLIIIIATIPDMEIIFEEKQDRLLPYYILMGMKETSYWVANFISSFVICFVCYLVASLVLVFYYGLKGNDFSMVFIFSILFVISEIMFQFFMSTFINNVFNGRWFIISIIMISIASGFVFQFTTFSDNSQNGLTVFYIFASLPLCSYQIFIMQGSMVESNHIPPFRWNNMNDSKYICPPSLSLIFIISEIFIYFILFVVLNGLLPRKYGFSPCAFRRKKNKIVDEDDMCDYNDDENRTMISVKNLRKEYKGEVVALDKVSFDVNKGDIFIIVGPNGAGKSTIINCLSGLLKPSDGFIIFNDSSYPPSIGVCFQENLLINKLTVKEHFELFGAFRGLSTATLQESMKFLFSLLNLSSIKNQKAVSLSGGQKRKLCISLSLLGNPKILLMDEPTSCVDVKGRYTIWKLLSFLKETTSVVVSHELEEAELISSTLLIMSDGNISFKGTSTELKKKYKCGYVLRVNISAGNTDPVLKLAQEFIPEAEISEDREDAIRIPDSNMISDFLFALSNKKSELGINSYTFSVEQFEDVLMNIVYN